MIKLNYLNIAISCAVISGTATLVEPRYSFALHPNCLYDDCEKEAPYSLRIITYGEGNPGPQSHAGNTLQGSRRVDVSLKTTHPRPDALPVATAIEAADRYSDSGNGHYWVSRDPTTIEPVLGIKVPATAAIEHGALKNPVTISIATNYGHFIDRWQLLILPANSTPESTPLHVLQGTLSGTITEIEWDGTTKHGRLADQALIADDTYDIALRVFDTKGNFDQTETSTITFVSTNDLLTADPGSLQATDKVSVKSLSEDLETYNRNYTRQSIDVTGSTVTVRGQDLNGIQTVNVNGEKIAINSEDGFTSQYILPPGNHAFEISAESVTGETSRKKLDIDVKPNYFFMVGMADLTIGKNNVSGSIEPLAVDEDHYGGDIFVDGRLAFYLKGKVRGKYLITAQMDTGTEDVSELFNNFHRKDASSVFRRIDPDQYYLLYGDDSTIVEDTDSQGKLYLRVDWDKSHALWGNFNTAFSGTEYAAFNRSLYGARLQHRSHKTTTLGDTKTQISAFMSESQTRFRHNEFEATGGSLYYLRDQDIVLGSEKIWIEVRRNSSEQVLQKIALVRGRDYELDEFQGRILLTRPLLSVSTSSGPSIIRDEPQPDDNTFLVVDYEYAPSTVGEGDATFGVRGKQWITDHIAVGGTWAHENRDNEDYDIKGLDVTVRKTDNTYFRVEVAQSESGQNSGSFDSGDGGLTFTPFNSNSSASSGMAVGLEARVTANDILSVEKPIVVAAWSKYRDAGFSTAGLDNGTDTTDRGIEVVAELRDSFTLSGRATQLEKKNTSRETTTAFQADYKYSDYTTLSAEVRRVRDEVFSSGEAESATLGAGKMQVKLTDSVSVYGIAQGVLQSSGNYNDNTLLTAGATARIDDKMTLSTELSSGDRGTNLQIGAERKMSDTYSIYSNFSLLNNPQNELRNATTLGQRKTLSDNLKIYTEHQFSDDDKQTGLANTIGLSNTFNRHATGTLSVQSSRIEDEQASITRRNTVSTGLSYKYGPSHVSSKLEYRRDKSDTTDTDQWVMTNHLDYRQSPSLRWQARLNTSSTSDRLADDDARFTEAGVGFAYRPVNNDRFNLLGRLTYLHDLPPLSQADTSDTRSSIYSVEGMYELGKRWSIGGKLAHRDGRVRLQRNGGDWVSNDAALSAFRVRYKAPLGADVIGSYHWLKSDASDTLLQGALLALGYNVSTHLQFSVGYNFTGFDDNLATDDYDVRGWFLNLVGKY